MSHLLSLWTNADLMSIEILNTNFKISKFNVSNDSHFVEASLWLYNRADSNFAPSQWEMSLQSNGVSHWLGTNDCHIIEGKQWD